MAAAANALPLIAVKAMPVGSISPFCEPATTTSAPHSSVRKSTDAREEIVSTRKSAGGFAVHQEHRLDAMLLVVAQPGFQAGRVDGAAPIVGQGLDLEPEGFAAHP